MNFHIGSDWVDVVPGVRAVARVGVVFDGTAIFDDPAFHETYLGVNLEWGITEVAYRSSRLELRKPPGGPELSGSVLRTLPFDRLLIDSMAKMVRKHEILFIDGFAVHGYSVTEQHARELREHGPIASTLDVLARLYVYAGVLRVPRTKFLADQLRIPHRTASHWIRLAKQRGHLPSGGDDG